MAYKSIPVEENLYKLLSQMKKSMNLRSFNELIAVLVSKRRSKSMLGSAKWMKNVKRDEEDRF